MRFTTVAHHYRPRNVARVGQDSRGSWRINTRPTVRERFMDDELNQAADDLVMLTPDQKVELEQQIARFQCAADALCVLARRPYLTAEQKALILAEADELVEEDIEPLRAALRDVPMSTVLQATVEELSKAGHEPP